MLIETAERLKKEWTDQYVKIARNAPELKRFQGLTGCVKTVNMNGRALVQFDNGIDISWYDIDPSYLNKVEKPTKATPADKPAEASEKSASPAASAPAAKPAAAGAKKSPLELAREQASAKAGAAPPAMAGAKKSPLELAREQAASKSGNASESPAKSGTAPASAKKSPLELAREQAAAKGAKKTETASDSETAASTPDAETPVPSATPTAAPATPGKKLSPLELARQQGAAKKQS